MRGSGCTVADPVAERTTSHRTLLPEANSLWNNRSLLTSCFLGYIRGVKPQMEGRAFGVKTMYWNEDEDKKGHYDKMH